MTEIAKKPIKITETILRDAHQSLIATRMSTEQMLPIVEKLDEVGYHSLECWGGATFDASLRFLKEDPWDRLRKIRARAKKTKLQMLFRGQNILGYRLYGAGEKCRRTQERAAEAAGNLPGERGCLDRSAAFKNPHGI